MATFWKTIGLDYSADAMQMQKVLEDVRASSQVFKGYLGQYQYKSYDLSEVTAGRYPVAWDALNTPTQYTWGGVHNHFRSDIYWAGFVEESLDIAPNDPLSRCVSLYPHKGRSHPLPIHMVHADVLPSLSYGDFVVMQMACFPKAVRYDAAATMDEDGVVQHASGMVLSLRELMDPLGDTPADPTLVSLRAKIVHSAVRAPLGEHFCPLEYMVHNVVETEHGELVVVHPLSWVDADKHYLMNAGNYVQVSGWLSADVAIGDYQEGAIFDVEHYLRLLCGCLRDNDFTRLRPSLASTCQYISEGTSRAQGAAAVQQAFIHDFSKEENIKFAYGEVEQADQGALFGDGTKCLVVVMQGNAIRSTIVINTDEHGKIASIVQDFKCHYTVKGTFSSHEWAKGNYEQASPPDVADTAENADAGDDNKLTEEERRFRTEGDMDSFMGEPFEGLGNAWEALCPTFSQRLAEMVEKSTLAENCRGKDSQGNAKGFLLQYPDTTNLRAGCLLDNSADGKSMELISAYPLLPGYPNQLKILARYTWSNGLEGEVAAETPSGDGPRLSFFAPFYFRDAQRFTPGGEAVVELSAVAQSLYGATLNDFVVDKGPFYEMQLQDFLAENPGKSEKDFEPPVVKTKGMVACIAQKITCCFEFRSPVMEVTPCTFLDAPAYRLLISLTRGAEEEDVKCYLYSLVEKMNGLIPTEGEDIEGVLWLTGTLAENVEHTRRLQ